MFLVIKITALTAFSIYDLHLVSGLGNQRESANQIRAWIRVTANNENPNGFALKKLLNVKTCIVFFISRH